MLYNVLPILLKDVKQRVMIEFCSGGWVFRQNQVNSNSVSSEDYLGNSKMDFKALGRRRVGSIGARNIPSWLQLTLTSLWSVF